MDQDLREQLRLVVRQTLVKAQTPGAAVAIRVNGQVFLETGIGYQDRNHDVPLSTDANFYIYSITKKLKSSCCLTLSLR